MDVNPALFKEVRSHALTAPAFEGFKKDNHNNKVKVKKLHKVSRLFIAAILALLNYSSIPNFLFRIEYCYN